jgi:hypothetical protein
MDMRFGEGQSMIQLPGFWIGDTEMTVASYHSSPYKGVSNNSQPGKDMPYFAYQTVTYAKTATWLKTLENIVGTPVFDAFMKSYYQKYKFSHPKTADFVDHFNAFVPSRTSDPNDTSYTWFFEQTLYGNGVSDYKVAGFNSRTQGIPKGIIDAKLAGDTSSQATMVSNIYLERAGEVIVPVDVAIRFQNGDTDTLSWDGKDRLKTYTVRYPYPVVSVEIDPLQKNLMDVNPLNNARSRNDDQVSRTWLWRYTSSINVLIEYFFQLIAAIL